MPPGSGKVSNSWAGQSPRTTWGQPPRLSGGVTLRQVWRSGKSGRALIDCTAGAAVATWFVVAEEVGYPSC